MVVVTVGYIIAIAGVMAISGDFIRSILDHYLHINPPWQVVTGVLIALVGAMVLNGVKVSTRVALVMVLFEVVYLVVASIFILVHTSGSISLKPLDPGGYTNGVHGFGIAFALAVFIYLGWENSASLAEETIEPRRNIPGRCSPGWGRSWGSTCSPPTRSSPVSTTTPKHSWGQKCPLSTRPRTRPAFSNRWATSPVSPPSSAS